MRILDAHMLFMRLGSRFTYMLLWLLMHYCHTRLYYKSCQEMLWPSICANVAFCQLFCLLEYCAGRSIVATFYLNLMTEAHLYSIYLLRYTTSSHHKWWCDSFISFFKTTGTGQIAPFYTFDGHDISSSFSFPATKDFYWSSTTISWCEHSSRQNERKLYFA